MKTLVFIAAIFCLQNSMAQDLFEQKVSRYKSLISNTTNGQRVLWMDSLTNAIKFNAEYKYDSVVRATIDFAIAEDSIGIAAKNISDLIYYQKSYRGDSDEAISVSEKYSFIQPQMKKEDLARMYLNIGNVYQSVAKLDKAIQLYNKAKKLAAEIGHYRYLGLAEMYIGQSLSMKGQFAKAAMVLKQAAPFFRKTKDTINIINVKNSISILYSQNGFFKEAEKERQDALELTKAIKDNTYLVTLNYNAATDYQKTNEKQKRINSLLAAYNANLLSEYKNYMEIPVLSALVRAYIDAGNIPEATKYMGLMEKDKALLEEPHKNASYLLARKHYDFAIGNYEKALELGITNLKQRRDEDQYEDILNAEKFLFEVYEKLGDNKKALAHLKVFHTMNDSINSAQKVKGMSYYQTLYETEKRDLKIKAQETNIAFLAEKNKVKSQWLLFGFIGLILLFGFVLLIRSRNNYKKLETLQANFSKELMFAQEQERNRVAKDLHDSVGQQLSMIRRKAENDDQKELAVMTAKTLDEVRSISRGLYPPMLKKLGLSKSISQMLFELDEETDLFISTEIAEIDSFFNEEETLNFYRFIQESVTNVIRHSEAKTLVVQIMLEGKKLHAIIKDNGKGIENIEGLSQNNLGLKTMRERIKLLKGKFSIESAKATGTTIEAIIIK